MRIKHPSDHLSKNYVSRLKTHFSNAVKLGLYSLKISDTAKDNVSDALFCHLAETFHKFLGKDRLSAANTALYTIAEGPLAKRQANIELFKKTYKEVFDAFNEERNDAIEFMQKYHKRFKSDLGDGDAQRARGLALKNISTEVEKIKTKARAILDDPIIFKNWKYRYEMRALVSEFKEAELGSREIDSEVILPHLYYLGVKIKEMNDTLNKYSLLIKKKKK